MDAREVIARGVHATVPLGSFGDDLEYTKDCYYQADKILAAIEAAGFVIVKRDEPCYLLYYADYDGITPVAVFSSEDRAQAAECWSQETLRHAGMIGWESIDFEPRSWLGKRDSPRKRCAQPSRGAEPLGSHDLDGDA